MSGADLISQERARQESVEGWTPEHDDEHSHGELAVAAGCYIEHATCHSFDDIAAYRSAPAPDWWPWAAEWWKPKNPVRDLVRAGALLAAEIDRRERANAERYAASVSK